MGKLKWWRGYLLETRWEKETLNCKKSCIRNLWLLLIGGSRQLINQTKGEDFDGSKIKKSSNKNAFYKQLKHAKSTKRRKRFEDDECKSRDLLEIENPFIEKMKFQEFDRNEQQEKPTISQKENSNQLTFSSYVGSKQSNGKENVGRVCIFIDEVKRNPFWLSLIFFSYHTRVLTKPTLQIKKCSFGSPITNQNLCLIDLQKKWFKHKVHISKDHKQRDLLPLLGWPFVIFFFFGFWNWLKKKNALLLRNEATALDKSL